MRNKSPILSKKRKPFKPQTKKRKGPLPFRYVILISFTIFCFFTVIGLVIVEQGIRPTLVDIARTETQRIGTLAINDAISKKILEESGLEDILDYHMDDTGRVSYVEINAPVYLRVHRETVKRVQDYLNDIEHGRIRDLTLPTDVEVDREGATFTEDGIIHMIPLGQATNNALLAHLGPRIPVRLSAIGDVKANYSREVITTGINNTWISIFIDIEVDVRIVIPFSTETEVVKTSIPVAMAWFPGEVPEFYSSGGDGMNPAIIPDIKERSPEESKEREEYQVDRGLDEMIEIRP
ncbi:sporulation protein YunB [Evansella tamaricis]|uniref:Sporulation protein YunB n=1 Tax=Evansella tamaricis TaxID=2069301 RepID=A0ABS6JHY6_9BACI|nr:sporulation protein YunB [Evansella tamaricis]MBU9712995.1 sporulation protein YunB [Evansella tamaricis]